MNWQYQLCTTVHNAIVGFAFSFKCLKIQCVAAVTEDLKQKRREYSRWLLSQLVENKKMKWDSQWSQE